MRKTNYNLIVKAILPIGILLSLVLISELKTEGDFGGIIDGFKLLFFLFTGAGIFLFTSIKNIRRIKKGENSKESKIILTVLLVSTLIGISSFWFPYDFFDNEPEFIAKNEYGKKLTLSDGKYILKIPEFEWTTIKRGKYRINSDTIYLDIDKEDSSYKSDIKYLIKDEDLIPIYSNEIETDSFRFLKIVRKIKN